MEDLLPISCEFDSNNYLLYQSWYMEKMRCETEVYQEFVEGKFVVKTNRGISNAVSRDKLEQTIQRS